MADALLAQAAGYDVDWEEIFEGASVFVQTSGPLLQSLPDEAKLKLYALFKQATEGDVSSAAPGLLSLDFKSKRKWQAWNALKGLTLQGAMQSYVMLVEELFPDWQGGQNAGGEAAQGGAFKAPTTSTLAGDNQSSDQEAETLHHFAGQGNIVMVQKLIAEGADVNARDKDGATPLHWACDRGSADVAAFLLGHGASVSAVDDCGMSALHYAAINEHRAVCEQLLVAGADLSLQDEDGKTPEQLGPAEWTLWRGREGGGAT